MRITAHRTVYKDPAFYCGPGPSVAHDPESNRLTILFRRVKSWLSDGLAGHWHPATETCLTYSDDLGETWSPPRVIMSGWQCPCLTRLRDGAFLHSSHRFELVSEKIGSRFPEVPGVMTNPWNGLHAGTAIHRSSDGGVTWGEPVWLDDVPDEKPFHPSLHTPIAVRGNILELTTGRLILSAYGFGETNTAYLFQSTDSGVSWSYCSRIAVGFNETYLHETAEGELLAWMRAHGDRMSHLYLARSADGGQTWSEPLKQWKGHPAACATLGSENLAVAYGYRFPDAQGLRARILSPHGTDPSEELVIRDDGAVFDLGYPHAVSLPDGRVFIVYYINRKTDAPDNTAPRYIESCILTE